MYVSCTNVCKLLLSIVGYVFWQQSACGQFEGREKFAIYKFQGKVVELPLTGWSNSNVLLPGVIYSR